MHCPAKLGYFLHPPASVRASGIYSYLPHFFVQSTSQKPLNSVAV